MTTMTWYQNTRLKAIETLAFWHGRVNTRDLMERFGISRRISHSDITTYLNLAPGNLVYDRAERCFIATSRFKRVLTDGRIDEYLSLETSVGSVSEVMGIEHITDPISNVNVNIFRVVIRAIHESRGLHVHYRSLQRPEGTKRNLYPHTLVHSGFCWHVRAYCDERKEYRDFLISRFVGIPELLDSNYAHPEKADLLWNKMVTLQVAANPKLPHTERELIETDFEMVKGCLAIPTRAALLNYILQRYQISLSPDKGSARKNRLVLVNDTDLKTFLWEQ